MIKTTKTIVHKFDLHNCVCGKEVDIDGYYHDYSSACVVINCRCGMGMSIDEDIYGSDMLTLARKLERKWNGSFRMGGL